MAYTKIHEIRSTVDKAIDYISNPEKTDEKLLITSFACSEKTADIEFEMTRNKFNFKSNCLAYHCIQSFKPDEVTPEQAHSIGIQTADELLCGRYEYIVSTHIDRGHIHNHIIINGCSFIDGVAFGYEHNRKSNPAWKQLRKISDDICLENKLSVISMPEKGYGRCYYEWLQDQRDNSYKGKLKKAIDECILTAESFEDFLKKMTKEKNYEYKLRGKTLSFRAEEQERFTRCNRKRLGWYYEPEQIQKRIERQVKKRSSKITKENGLYQVHDENAAGLNRWAALKNMQETAKVLNLLADFNVGSMEQLEEKISENYDKKFDTVKALNDYEKEINSQRELLKILNTYWEKKEVHDQYLKAANKKKFKKENEEDLAVYESSKAWLRERYSSGTLPNRGVLEMKISETETKREALLEEYHKLKKDLNVLEKAHEKIEAYLDLSHNEQERKDKKGELE